MPKDKPEDSLRAYSHFATLNALVDSGWLAHLSGFQLAVYLVHLRHASDDGLTFPGPQKIAARVGHTQARHVREARKQLVTLGLLAVEVPGGGRQPKRLRVSEPPTVPRIGVGPKRGRQGALNRGTHPSPKSSYQPAPNPGNEQPSEQPIEQPTSTAGDGGGGFSLIEEREETRKALRAAGINEPTRSRLLDEVPTLTAAAVNEIRSSMDGDAGKGLLVEAIRADGAAKVMELRQREDEARARADAERAAAEELKRWAVTLGARYRADIERHNDIIAAVVEFRKRAGTLQPKIADTALKYLWTLKGAGTGITLDGIDDDAQRMMCVLYARDVKPDLTGPVDRRHDATRHASRPI